MTVNTSQNRRQILLRVRQLKQFDATSQDLLMQAKAFSQANFAVSIYCSGKDESLDVPNRVSLTEALNIASDPQAVIVSHYCGFDRDIWRFIFPSKAFQVLRYHNITPAKFFIRYSLKDALYSVFGRIQMAWLIWFRSFDEIWSPSAFNLKELFLLVPFGLKPNAVVLPAFTSILSVPGSGHREEKNIKPAGSQINVLFVGRFAPNKKLERFLDIARIWNVKYGEKFNLKIFLAGRSTPSLARYTKMLFTCLKNQNLEAQVTLKQDLSAQELNRTYDTSDIFVSLSEHEGFLVPLLEAQAHGVPVLALDRGAIGETLGDSGILLKNTRFSAAEAVEAIYKITTDPSLTARLVDLGQKNIERFSFAAMSKKLVELIESKN